MSATEGSRQHEGKRTKFSEMQKLVEEINLLSGDIMLDMNQNGSLPIFTFARMEAKFERAKKLLEIRR